MRIPSLVRLSLAVAVPAVMLVACNPSSCLPTITLPDAGFVDLHGTEDAVIDDLVVQGRVSLQNEQSQASTVSGATVRVTVDRDGNGVIAAGEATETTTDSDGKYRVQTTVARGTTVVVKFSRDGASSVFRSLQAGPKANVRMNITLVSSHPLACESGKCALADNRLTVRNLGAGLTGRARVFNPVTEKDQFPGSFDDASGNLLLSGVFSAVELEDGSGNPVSNLGTPAQLRMTLPRDTWRIVKDIHPGTAVIEVPMYAFDDVQGTWVQQGEGVLEDGGGRRFAESELAGIRAGTYDGTVVAAGEVSHFSHWNVDWPVDTKACLKGVVLGRDGLPAEGATVIASGLTYDGSSTGITVGADGSFCVDMMRSENAGEDVDQDGVNGETQRVSLRVAHRGLLYDGGSFDTPKTQGTCAGGGCTDVGTIRLSQDNELVPVTCTVHGTVRDAQGRPRAGLTVMGWDPAMESGMLMTVCFGGGATGCEFSTTTATDGTYTLRTAILDGASVFAIKSSEVETGRTRLEVGSVSARGCPAGATDITVEVFDTVNLAVTVSGTTVAWTPAVPATSLFVYPSQGDLKWHVEAAPDGGFSPPVTYGVVPAGATGGSPDGGTASPLVTGDRVTVVVSGRSSDGVTLAGSGDTTIP